jgi:hypothetical protein
MTAFRSYGEVARQRQAEIMRDLAAPQQLKAELNEELVKAVVKKLLDSGLEIQVK